MAIQDDNTILKKSDLKAYHEAIAPMLGGTFMVRTNNSDYYSTDEKVVGVWTDGKPVYQKTWTNIDVSGMIDGTNHNIIDITSLNADTTIKVEAIAHQLTSGQKYDYPNTFFNPATSSTGVPLKVNVWRRAENYIGINATNLEITSVDVTFCYTKTTDTATTSLTKPGCYDINRPDLWPTNKEIFFGNGLYGQRFTGTIATTTSPKDFTLATLPSTTKLVNIGGTLLRHVMGASYYDFAIPYNYENTMFALIAIDVGVLKFSVKNSGAGNIPYDVWVTYTK